MKLTYSTKVLRIMKLMSILLTVTCLTASAGGLSQKVTLKVQNASLSEVFAKLEAQTGFFFICTNDLLQRTGKVSMHIENVTLNNALDVLFKGLSLSYVYKGKLIVISSDSVSAIQLKSGAEVLAPPGNVAGRITDEEGKPLAGANVMLKGNSNQGTSTDINGYYKIENITAGEYTLVVSFVGYNTKTTVIKVTENGAKSLSFSLTPSLVNLDQLTVTSTLSARKIRSVPTTMAVITQADLKNRNLNNIANVLEAIPGIIISPGSEMYNSGNARTPLLLIRGASGLGVAGIKYIVDGVEIISLGGVQSLLQTMDPNSIEKIEVLKGPMASTLYGSGAGGGVISITTKKGKSSKTNVNFKTMFTDRSNDYADYKGYQQDYSLNVSGGNEQFNYLIGAGYNLYPTTKLTDVNNGLDDKTWSYNVRIGGKFNTITADLSLQYGNTNRGSGSTTISENKYRESLGLTPYPVYPLIDYRQSERSFLTSLHLTHRLTANWHHDLTIGYNIMSSDYITYTQSDYDGTYYNGEDLRSKMNVRYFMSYDYSWSEDVKSSITAGFEYNGYEARSIALNTTTPLTNFFSSSTPAIAGTGSYMKSPYSSAGYFAELVTGLNNNLFLTTGIRFDVNNAYGDNVGAYAQPRVGLSYVIELGKFKIKPRAVWGVSSDAPNPIYKTTTVTTSQFSTSIIVGNPKIKPQRSEGYEFGADIFYGSNYSLNVTYYNQKIKDMIAGSYTYDLNTSPITSYSYYYNIAEAINRGLEVSAKAVLNPFVIDISYTKTVSKWGDQIAGTPDILTYPGAPLSSIPKSSFNSRLTYSIPSFLSWTRKGGKISLDWRYNGSAFDLDNVGYSLAVNEYNNAPDPKPAYPDFYSYYLWQKGYSYFNLRADYSVTDYAAVYIDVQNLLDKQGSLNGQSLSQFPGRRFNFGFNINF